MDGAVSAVIQKTGAFADVSLYDDYFSLEQAKVIMCQFYETNFLTVDDFVLRAARNKHPDAVQVIQRLAE